MDTAWFLTLTIFLLTIVLIAVGIYLVLLLHEARQTLKRVNRLVDRVEGATNFIEQNFFVNDNRFVSIFGMFKEALVFITELKKTLKQERKTREP